MKEQHLLPQQCAVLFDLSPINLLHWVFVFLFAIVLRAIVPRHLFLFPTMTFHLLYLSRIRETAQLHHTMEQELAHAVNASAKSMDKVYAKSKTTEVRNGNNNCGLCSQLDWRSHPDLKSGQLQQI